jgi:protein TonB
VASPVLASNPSLEARYVRAIRLQIERHKRYPELARELDVSGRAGITYTINRSGQLIAVAVIKSSGSDILDKAALQAVRTALFPPIPKGAWRESPQKQFETTLIYSLTDN